MRPLILLTVVYTLFTFAQISDKVTSVSTGEAKEGQPLIIRTQLVQTDLITQVLLAYRPFGASEYTQVEMSVTGNTAFAAIPAADVIPTEMEYYLILQIRDKETPETFPIENPETHPLRVEVQPRTPKEEMVIFLSPEADSRVSEDELLISISLLRASAAVNRTATKIFIDNRNVTTFAVMTEDLITLLPENLSPPLSDGSHSIKVELYDTEGKPYHTSTMNFTQISLTAAEEERRALTYNASLQLESRHETIQDRATSYNRGNLTTSSQYGILRVNGRLYVTNEDKTDRQPQNRYFIEAQIPWLRVGYGDAYPVFPNLMMSGKRLRGLTSNLTLGFFNLDFAMGEVVRKVDGATIKIFPETDTVSLRSTQYSVGPYDTSVSPRQWAWYRYGTFKRNLTIVRPSFRSGDNVQIGFAYLTSKDDVGSIKYGIKPEENVALGSDLLVAFDNRRFEFTAQGGISLYNRDVSSGTSTDADIDAYYRLTTTSDTADVLEKRQDLKELRNLISKFITVNPYLIPLSVDNLPSIMAYEGALALNYFDNYLKASYIFRGSGYNSFGQTFIRKDIKGFNFYDRIRLLENQLFLSGGYERLEDNTDGIKLTTTTFSNWNVTASYFPRLDFPTVTLGFSQYASENGLPKDSLSSISDLTNRIFLQLGYNFTAGLRHSASLGVSLSNRDDETRRNVDTKNTTISASLMTTWKIPLQTSVSITQNLSKIPSPDPADTSKVRRIILSPFDYTTIFLGGRYRMMEDKLQVFASIGPTFGDAERTMWDIGAEYTIMRNLNASFQLSLFQIPSRSTDIVWSLMLKYNV